MNIAYSSICTYTVVEKLFIADEMSLGTTIVCFIVFYFWFCFGYVTCARLRYVTLFNKMITLWYQLFSQSTLNSYRIVSVTPRDKLALRYITHSLYCAVLRYDGFADSECCQCDMSCSWSAMLRRCWLVGWCCFNKHTRHTLYDMSVVGSNSSSVYW